MYLRDEAVEAVKICRESVVRLEFGWALILAAVIGFRRALRLLLRVFVPELENLINSFRSDSALRKSVCLSTSEVETGFTSRSIGLDLLVYFVVLDAIWETRRRHPVLGNKLSYC